MLTTRQLQTMIVVECNMRNVSCNRKLLDSIWANFFAVDGSCSQVHVEDAVNTTFKEKGIVSGGTWRSESDTK